MKKYFGILLVLLLVLDAQAITGWTLKLSNATNGPLTQTMGCQLLARPTALDTPLTVNGTNLIFAGNSTSNFTFMFDGTGVTSNALYAGTYQFILTNLNASFIAVIPDTASVQSLTLYITNIQVFSGVAYDSYGNITNLLHFAPATNTAVMLLATLGFQPATNTSTGILTPLNFQPATNSAIGILTPLGFQPATNTATGILTPLGFQPATNTATGILTPLNFQPATNTATGILTPLNFQPATNSNVGIITPLGYTPGTNGYIGISALSGIASIATNGFLWIISYKTNNDPGAQFTNAPMGSLMTTTNGQMYCLSNIVWRLK